MISIKPHQLRDVYRKRLRKDQIFKYQQQIRKHLISSSQGTLRQCPICLNLQSTQASFQIMAIATCEAFNKRFICHKHIEPLISKVLAIISESPQHLPHFIYKDVEEETQFYIRKVVLVLQAISNQILVSNEQVQTQFYLLFSDTQGFGQKLFDSAYGLNNHSFYEEQSLSLSQNAEIKRISFNTLLLIFFKYPLLLVEFFDEYPMVWLLRQCNENKLLQIYDVLLQIFSFGTDTVNEAKLCVKAEECLKQHIQQTKTLKHGSEVEQKLLWLIDKFLQIKPLPTPETMFQILCLYKNKSPTSIIKVYKTLAEISSSQSLNQSQQKLLVMEMKMAETFYESDCDRDMQIEEL